VSREVTGAAALAPRAAAVRRRLLAWYGRAARDLPWRRVRVPYAILVSEIMLQQTRVTRVSDYWPRFLGRYPTLEDLAEAPLRDVLGAWRGLGYYARARNLHATARYVVRRHDGRLPTDPRVLARLPGIGRYTAAAVASIAFDAPLGTVDTNIARVLARVFRVRGRRGSSAQAAALWRLAARLAAPGRAAEWNQALMDLGATICVARAPRCERCPVASLCPIGIARRGPSARGRATGGRPASGTRRPVPARARRRAGCCARARRT
jgi:A/G-specific adenine glycosylase